MGASLAVRVAGCVCSWTSALTFSTRQRAQVNIAVSRRARAEMEGHYEGEICHVRCLPPEPGVRSSVDLWTGGCCCVGARSVGGQQFSAQGPITPHVARRARRSRPPAAFFSPPRDLAACSLKSPLRLPRLETPLSLRFLAAINPSLVLSGRIWTGWSLSTRTTRSARPLLALPHPACMHRPPCGSPTFPDFRALAQLPWRPQHTGVHILQAVPA